MPAPSTRLQSLINTALIPGAVDQVINYSPATLRLIGNAMEWPVGSRLERPVKVSSTNLGGAFTGLQEFSTSDVATSVKLTYDIGAYEHPVVVPGLEKLLNDGSEAQRTSLVTYKVEEAKAELASGIATLLVNGNSNANFVSLRDIADDGGQTASIGGQLRATYSSLQGTDTASGGTVSLTKIRTLISAISPGSIAGGYPTMALSDQTVWGLVESLLSPIIQAQYGASGYPQLTLKSRAPVKGAELMGAAGFNAIVYAGIPFVADEVATAQSLYMLNEDWLQWYGKFDPDLQKVDLGSDKGVQTVYHQAPSKFHGFNWQDLMRAINQYGEVGHLFLFGQLASWQPRRQGVLTGVTGV